MGGYCEAGLNSLSEVLKNEVADHSGDGGNSEIRGGEDIPNSESESLFVAICMLEFAHQQIGIEQEDDETNLNQRPPNWGQLSGRVRIRRHWLTIARIHS